MQSSAQCQAQSRCHSHRYKVTGHCPAGFDLGTTPRRFLGDTGSGMGEDRSETVARWGQRRTGHRRPRLCFRIRVRPPQGARCQPGAPPVLGSLLVSSDVVCGAPRAGCRRAKETDCLTVWGSETRVQRGPLPTSCSFCFGARPSLTRLPNYSRQSLFCCSKCITPSSQGCRLPGESLLVLRRHRSPWGGTPYSSTTSS